jgi:DNA-binding transcriptional LysR family regulator
MELRHIRYFVRAAELLHFTHAAESLLISQPTLSSHIQQLEDEVGLPLFDRIGRQVRLTEAGRIMLEHANSALRMLDDAREEIAERKGNLMGSLRLSALVIFGYDLLPTWVGEFNAMYPQVKISCTTGSPEFVERELAVGNADLVLNLLPGENRLMERKVLFEEELVFAVGTDHPLAMTKEISFEKACEAPLVLMSTASPVRKILNRHFEERGITPNVLFEVDEPNAIRQIIHQGKLATFLARRMFEHSSKINWIPISNVHIVAEFGVVRDASRRLSPPARAFLQYLCSENTFADVNHIKM